MSYGGSSRAPKGYEKGRMQNFTPEQMQLLQNSIQQLGPDGFLSKLAGGDQAQFAQMEAPALRQFSGIQGNIASKFSGMGMGGRNSSGFQNTMNAAASDFAQDLQGKRMDLQMKAIQDMQHMSNELMGQRPYQNYLVKKEYRPKKNSFWEDALGGALKGGLSGFMAGGGNPFAGLAGALWGGGSSGYQSSGAGYDQEFRTNPGAMGY